ncbi:hypothetical protein MAR_026021 [Mya arenaria]|uniref:Uncharacterized protein n=1 Tax=Mya arenaria TaxID=6604 RepID=A0ABY7ESY8_MYAAR|nr:hypothetical protein MAR_026021 [Mya arenaria]
MLKDERKSNYVSCKIALDKTGEAMLPFTEDKLKDLHQQISLQVGNQPICHQQCNGASPVACGDKRWFGFIPIHENWYGTSFKHGNGRNIT